MTEYLHLQPESELPDISNLQPFKAVLVIEELVSPEWQAKVSSWLVQSGCLYMMAWGRDCSSWDDSVDFANMEAFNFQEIPEERFVLTTWHEHEPLSEVFWFSKQVARHLTVSLQATVILHIASSSRRQQLVAEYEDA